MDLRRVSDDSDGAFRASPGLLSVSTPNDAQLAHARGDRIYAAMNTTTADVGDHRDERDSSAVAASRPKSSHVRQPGVLISSAGRRGALVQLFQTTLSDMFGGGAVVAADMSPL